MQLVTYLMFKDNCAEAFKFYEKCLGGKITGMFTYAETPAGTDVPPEAQKLIMHARLEVGDAVLMGSDDCMGGFAPPAGFSVSLMVGDPAEAERIFGALSEGGEVRMPIGETFWALRFGMLTDRFGIPWMVNCEKAS